MIRQHCRLNICEYWLSWTNTDQNNTDPNNHPDTETGTLSNNDILYLNIILFADYICTKKLEGCLFS